MITRAGGCNCGAVRLSMRGEPSRFGLCHCLTCRKETGAPFLAFVVYPQDAVTVEGETARWTERAMERHFCPICGSPLFTIESEAEIEMRLGAFDEGPTGLAPSYESWTVRREHWLQPLPGTAQYEHDRT